MERQSPDASQALIQQEVESQRRNKSPTDYSGRALRNRSRDASTNQERSKSPQMSQASNIIRRKYSQLRTMTSRPQEENVYGSNLGSPNTHDYSEPQP